MGYPAILAAQLRTQGDEEPFEPAEKQRLANAEALGFL